MNAVYHPRDVFAIIDICSLWIKDLKSKEHTVKREDLLLSGNIYSAELYLKFTEFQLLILYSYESHLFWCYFNLISTFHQEELNKA